MIARALCILLALSATAQAVTAQETEAADAPSALTPLAQTLTIGEPADPSVPDLILIPGIGLSLEAWRPWMEANAGRYRMHAVTLPGMAGTAPPPLPDPPTSDTPFLDNAAAAVADFIETNSLDRPVVIGHGTGGMVALLVGVRHPDLIRAYASITMPPAIPLGNEPLDEAERLAHAFGIVQPSNSSATAQQAAASLIATYAPLIADETLSARLAADAARNEPHVLSQYWPEVVSMDLIDEIAAQETVPVLIGLPTRGPFRNAAQWHAIADACDAMMLVEFSSSASFCHYDEPERFGAALQALITRANPAQAVETDR